MRSDIGSEEVFKLFNLTSKLRWPYFVDVGAGIFGNNNSNTLWMSKAWHSGMTIEYSDAGIKSLREAFGSNTKIIQSKVNPDNIVQILTENKCPKEFGFLSLDIDSYDYFVLDKILSSGFKPEFICCEINEKIPPPIRSIVNYLSEDQVWKENDCFGMSIETIKDFEKYGYKAFYLDYNNVYLSNIEDLEYKDVSTLYDEGYKYKADRRERYPWNNHLERWMLLPMYIALGEIQDHFRNEITEGLMTIELKGSAE